MNQDPYLIWRLVVPHLDTLETIILLSKTSRGLYSVAVEQDRLDLANKAPGTWIPVGYWALYHCLLGHLELALEAASQTHKLHANTCISFAKHSRSNCNQYRVFSTSDGFCAEFVSAFEFLMSLSFPDFLNEILFHPNFSHLPEVKWAGYPIWRPLLFPSVAFVFEHPLSKFALVTSKHSFDFICLMTAWFQSIARIAYTMALFDANYPRFEDQTSDCISEMSLDFSEDGDDDDVGVDHVEEIQAVEEIGSPVTDLFEAASWNAEERINEGGVEDAYLEFRTEKEPVDETSDLDSEDRTESQIDVINCSNEKDSFLVIVKDCAGDR
ncbi:hypothetical protein BDR26DRAFT_849233, partial [Obelidium mucronatum]